MIQPVSTATQPAACGGGITLRVSDFDGRVLAEVGIPGDGTSRNGKWTVKHPPTKGAMIFTFYDDFGSVIPADDVPGAEDYLLKFLR